MQKNIAYSLSALAVLVSLTACGGGSGATSDNQSPDIAVSSSNTIPVPVVRTVDGEVPLNQGVTFDASESYDPDGDQLTYAWKDSDGKLLSAEAKIDRLFNSEGTHTMTLYITDEKGGVATKNISVKVTRHGNATPSGDQPPVVETKVDGNDVDLIDVNSGDVVHFADNGSYDPDGGNIVSYEWRDMDGILLSNGPTLDRALFYRPQHDFNHDGTTRYEKTLYVTDDEGSVSSKTITVIVHQLATNTPPVVDLGPDKYILAGQHVTLRADASDPDGVIDYYIWKKGSTVVAEGPYMSTFTTANLAVGDHHYSVTVRDNDGAETTDDIVIHVSVTGAGGGTP